ncbi:MAG: C69 family dipeptidase [Bacteroidales bacterium]|nr:C69 family dipeptidase [Bacteroidales bacterium]
MSKIIFIYIRFLIILILLFPSELFSQQQECFLLMVGKDASANGQVLLAHNNDLSGNEASMLIKVPANEMLNILPDSSVSFHPSYEMLILQTNIGFAEGDAVAINKHGVAIAGGLALKRDRNSNAEKLDPLVKSGLGGGIRYFALQHAKTARECVKIIGECYTKFGISYPSGVGVADTNEIWYMEAGGGYSWAAVRIPNDCYFVAANSYRIGNIDFNDTANFICSPKLIDIYEESDLRDKSMQAFNFRDFFGNGIKEKTGSNYYNTRRLWRAIDILNPLMQVSSEEEIFPLFIQAQEKIDLQKCFTILRDYYSETPFDIYKNENPNHPERSIAVWKCVHTDVIALSPGKPVDYGSVLWTGLSSPFTAIYIPIYMGSNAFPAGFDVAPKRFDKNSAFWVFKKLGDLSKSEYPRNMKAWKELRNQLESNGIEKQEIILREAENRLKNNPNQLSSYLENRSKEFAFKAIRLASDMTDSLENNNNIKLKRK